MAIDFVARNEFDYTIKEVAEGRDWSKIVGLSYRNADGIIVHNRERPILEDMDQLPFVTPVYKRDLVVENYFGRVPQAPLHLVLYRPWLQITLHLLSLAADGRRSSLPGAKRGPRHRRAGLGKAAFPQVKEFFFDDDTLTDNLPRVEALAKEIGKLGLTWSCNAKANVPLQTLKVMKDNGLRLSSCRLRIRQSADPAQHQEGHAGRRRPPLHQGLP